MLSTYINKLILFTNYGDGGYCIANKSHIYDRRKLHYVFNNVYVSLAGEPIEQKKNKYSWFIVPHLTIYILGVYHGRSQDLFQGEGACQPGVGNTNFYIIF